MSKMPVQLVVSLVRRALRWQAEVIDPRSPVAGLMVRGLTRGAARRRLMYAAADELGQLATRPCLVEVTECRTATYSLYQH